MKKIFSVLILFLLIFSLGIAGAEQETKDVILVGGLEYGMSYEDAQKVSGYDVEELPYYEVNAFEKFGLTNPRYLSGKGNIGGYEARVSVYFDSDDKLIQVQYQLGIEEFNYLPDNIEESDVLRSDYLAVEEILQQTYGDSIEQEFPIMLPHGYYKMYTSLLLFGNVDYDYSARMILQSTGNSILIEHERHLCFYQDGHFVNHIIAYTYYDGDYTQPAGNNSVDF